MAKITYTDKVIGSKWKAIDANEVKDSVNDLYDEVDDKVDKVTGKQLSTEDFTTAEKTKLDSGVIFNQTDEIQDAAFSIAYSAHVGGYGAEEVFVSPQITGHQGYTTDGTFHYIFDTARIDKRNNDGSWSIALSNTTPFTGTTGGLGHLGAGDYSAGVLYAPAKISSGCASAVQKILTYNATTLALINQFDISAQGHEAAAIAIDGVNNIAYIVSFCDGSKFWMYNATTFAFIGSVDLQRTLSRVQGVSYYNNKLYIASEDDGILTHDLTTGALTLLISPLASYTTPEGVKVVNGQVRWLVDNNGGGTASFVHYFDPATDPQGFYTDQSGLSYFGGKLRVNNVLSVYTDTEDKGSIHTATRLGKSSALYIESADPANTAPMVGTVGHDITNTYLSRNAEFSGGVWRRPDIVKSSFAYLQSNTRHEWRTATDGGGTITWDTRMTLSSEGELSLNGGTSVTNPIFKAAWNTSNFSVNDFVGTSGVAMHSVASPTTTNYFLRAGTGTLTLNAPLSSGNISFALAASIKANIMPTTGNLILQNAGTFTDIPSARLIVNSTTQGFLPPRMTTTERNAIASPVAGLEIYNTTTNKKNFYNGTAWEAVTSA